MLSSLFSAISGLNANGHAMDVIGNNVPMLTTVGYKASRVTFPTCSISRYLAPQGPARSAGALRSPSVDTLFQQGSFETTNEPIRPGHEAAKASSIVRSAETPALS